MKHCFMGPERWELCGLRTVSGCEEPVRKELWIIAFGKITLGKGRVSSTEASYSFTMPALFTHSPGKAELVFVSICFPKCLKGAPNTCMVEKSKATLKTSAILT